MKITEIKQGIIGIYKMTLNNNKIYIGLSNDIRRRMNEHMSKDLKENPEILINKAVIEHGLKDVEILEEMNSYDRDFLKDRERYWIKSYNSYLDRNIGYNLTPGGDGGSDGIDNTASYLTLEDLNKIYELLRDSQLSYEEIALQTNSTYSIVSRINNGHHYHDKKFNYPIRKTRIEKIGLENKTSRFYNNKEMLLDIVKELQSGVLTQQEISKKYDVSVSIISLINKGEKYAIDGIHYPLREFRQNTSHKRIFSNEELNQIKLLLLNGETMTKIGKIVKCDRKIISDINAGIRQSQKDWSYPIR